MTWKAKIKEEVRYWAIFLPVLGGILYGTELFFGLDEPTKNFWIPIIIGGAGGMVSSYTSRLHATGLWAGRALSDPAMAKFAPNGLHDALTHGWPSMIVFFSNFLPLAAIGLGFFNEGLVLALMAYGSFILAGVVADLFLIGRFKYLEVHLMTFLIHAEKRRMRFASAGNSEKAEAADWLAGLVKELLHLYVHSEVLAPKVKVAMSAPLGDRMFLLQPYTE